MSENFLEGTLVELFPKPEFGLGKVLKISSGKIYVFFRNQPNQEALIFKLDDNQLTTAAVQSDPVLDNLPPFIEQPNGKLSLSSKSKRWTLQQTIDAFHTMCPLGFSDPAYLKGERKDKWAAHEKFVETLGGGQGQKLLAEGKISAVTDKALAVISKANMFLSFESMAINDALKNQQAANRYFTELFSVLGSPVISEAVYQPYLDSVLDLPQESGKSKVATWPVATLLPFIAQPNRHMFLKPSTTQAAAEALAFDLRYKSQPNWRTYEALLEMGKVYFNEVKHLKPRDSIDVQSFIWVAGHD